jgi:2-C-methyl-D-erythritol 4-phosphate cytidylyltransferase
MTATSTHDSAQLDPVWAVIPAAGIGLRMGETVPKQYLKIAGRTLIEYGCDALLDSGCVSGLVIAVQADDQLMARLPMACDPRVHLVTGGAQRADSVLAGLEFLASRAGPQDWVMVHDAARPCLDSLSVQHMCRQLAQHSVGGILARPVTDTVKQAGAQNAIEATLPRETLWTAQTPQMFRFGLLLQALRSAQAAGIAVTDESMALERMGYQPLLLSGPPSNIKVTYPQDLALASWYLANRSET